MPASPVGETAPAMYPSIYMAAMAGITGAGDIRCTTGTGAAFTAPGTGTAGAGAIPTTAGAGAMLAGAGAILVGAILVGAILVGAGDILAGAIPVGAGVILAGAGDTLITGLLAMPTGAGDITIATTPCMDRGQPWHPPIPPG